MKRILIFLFFVSVFFPINSVRAVTLIPESSTSTSTPMQSSTENIQQIVKEKTPNFIARPILYVTNKIDSIREVLKVKIENRKAKLALEINPSEEAGPLQSQSKTSEFLGAFKYLEMFFLIILLIIFSVGWLLYTVIVVLIFLICRFIYYRLY